HGERQRGVLPRVRQAVRARPHQQHTLLESPQLKQDPLRVRMDVVTGESVERSEVIQAYRALNIGEVRSPLIEKASSPSVVLVEGFTVLRDRTVPLSSDRGELLFAQLGEAQALSGLLVLSCRF